MTRRELHAEFVRLFNRMDVTLDHIKSLCTRKGWKSGRTGCFPVGHVPANKGMKMPYNENSARTQFKNGHMPHNTKYLGHERLSKDGYVEICINRVNPHTGFKWRYVLKHRWLWEKENGSLPAGMCLKCLDGNKQNTDPANWEAISRSILPLLNGKIGLAYDRVEPELKPTVLSMAKVKHALHAKAKLVRK